MSSKILTLTLSDQNLLRVALNYSIQHVKSLADCQTDATAHSAFLAEAKRIDDLKARLV